MTTAETDRSRNEVAIDELPDDCRQRLIQVLDRYMEQLERGVPTSAEDLIAAHPDLEKPLRGYLKSLDFLHQATVAEPCAVPAGSSSVDDQRQQLGDFRLLREIGRGGMGIVYEARQLSLGRTVALKILPFAAVLDQKQIVRFTTEAQAAAQLRHDNIVPVYSVGCDRGVHYYSMQFIDGRPLDQVISELRRGDRDMPEDPDATPISPPRIGDSTVRAFSTAHSVKSRSFVNSAARLGVDVAEALDHAHQLGVVHRDVKPSNLLIDVEGKPWITDFGLARVQAGANVTMTGDVLGTARYMSPEQATGNGSLVDQRTDVYSLGVTLYELLTLTQAFEGADRAQIISRIAQEEPVRPRKLNPSIPVDLETILLKAIAKRRDQRYETAQELADDLRRFLDGKPTLAKRPTWTDRAGKWAARHRLVVGVLAAAAAILLSIALVATAVSRHYIAAALETANDNYLESEQQRQRAEHYLGQARNLVDDIGVKAEALKNVPGAEDIRDQWLRETLRYYQAFIRDAGDDPSLEFVLAVTCSKAGDLIGQIGDKDEALAHYAKARDLFRQQVDRDPQDTHALANLALCWNNIGLLETDRGRTEVATGAFRKSIAMQEKLHRQVADQLQPIIDLAQSYNNLGLVLAGSDQDDAERAYGQAIDLLSEALNREPDDPAVIRSLAVSYNNVSFLNSRTKPEEARRTYEKAIALQKKRVDRTPGDIESMIDLARTYNNLAMLDRDDDRFEDAETNYRRSIDLLTGAHRRSPLRTDARRDLAITYNNLARVHSSVDEHEQAVYCLEQARSGFEWLVREFPRGIHYHSSLGGVLNNLGMAWQQQGKLAEAAEAYAAAVKYQRTAWSLAPEVTEYRDFLNKHYYNYAGVLRMDGRPVEAAEISLERRRLWNDDPNQLYTVGEELALAAELIESPSIQEVWVQRSLDVLEQALEAGFATHEDLAVKPELASLSGQARFRDFVLKLNQASSDDGERK